MDEELSSFETAQREIERRAMAAEPFVEFPKISRLFRPVIITEKIDGTNACVRVAPEGGIPVGTILVPGAGWVRAGSRTRWLTREQDNFGFAAWVEEHAKELVALGPGTHFGEWWGRGIQRGYGLQERRFSLFNTSKWGDEKVRPACCSVVPVLSSWNRFDSGVIEEDIEQLRKNGSVASPGFMKPEGVVVFHVAANLMFKVTVEKDEERKSEGRST